MGDVPEQLLSLRFAPGPLQSLYLNEDRVTEQFVSQIGAVTEWTRSASTEGTGGVDLKVVHGDVGKTLGNQVTYDIKAALVRALLLKEAINARGAIQSPLSAGVGEYVKAEGRGCLRNPNWDVEGLHDRCIPQSDPRYLDLEKDRLQCERMRLALAGPAQTDDRMWLLVLTNGRELSCAAVLNSLWVNDAVISYMHARWTMFGTLRDRITGIPTVAAVHVWVDLSSDFVSDIEPPVSLG